MTSDEQEGGDTKEIVAKSSLSSQEWAIAEQFAAADKRLLVISADLASGEGTVEVAHEQLIRSWPSMFAWVKEDRAFLIWRRQELDALVLCF